MESNDRQYMLEALELAKLGWGLTNPNPMVGAVIVKDGQVIGRGFHRRAGQAHAEINALQDVERHGANPRGAVLYVTLEPCTFFGRTPPCTEAIVNSGISKVVIGALDANPKNNGRAVNILREHGVEVVFGVEKQECWQLNEHFFHWITTGKPFVMLKMAMTLDGKIATGSGDSKWITGVEARGRVQKWRRLADGIMVGGETLRTDHCRLTVRDPETWERQPQRIIATRRMSDADLEEYFPEGRAETVDLPDAEAWENFLLALGQRQYTFLLIEGGGEVAAQALQSRVVDAVEFHVAPKILTGRNSRPVMGGDGPEVMGDALPVRNWTWEKCGDDMIVRGNLKDN